MRKRNSLAILCASVFALSLLLTGCSGAKQSTIPSGDGTEQTDTGDTNKKTWTVTFDSKGGSTIAAQEVEDGQRATKPTDPTRSGFTFTGWFEDEITVTPFDFNCLIVGNRTLYAGWNEGGSGPQPEESDYTVTIGSISRVLVKSNIALLETQLGAYETTFASVTQGNTITFTDKDENVLEAGSEPDKDEGHKNNISGMFPSYVINNNAENVKVIFKTWEDDGYSFWVDGYNDGSAPITGDYVYTITDLPDWIPNDGCVTFAWGWSGSNPGSWYQTSFVNASTIYFQADGDLDGFLLARCCVGTTTPNWSETGDVAGRIYNQTDDIECVAGLYTYSCSDWKSYVPESGGESTSTYSAKIGTTPVALTEVELDGTDGPTTKHKYKGSASVTAGQVIEFYRDSTQLTPGADSGNNNASGTWPNYTIHNDADADIYLKIYEDGGASFWITGYTSGGGGGGGGTEVDVTYTITVPSWIGNDGCVVFAWVWSSSDSGSWKSVNYSGTTCTFTVTGELNGFLLARCKGGTTQPNYSESGHVAGRIYNKTSDINCVSGTYNYSRANDSDWPEYNP